MKKIIIPLLLCLLLAVILPVAALKSNAESGSSAEQSIPEDTLITYGYLEQFREQLKQEIIAELISEGGISFEQTYNDISLKEGETLILSADTEVIYRGGGAAAVTSSNQSGEGITDMSEGTELFSGQPLEYGHIYYASATDSKKAILVTGSAAYFTVRGSYEIG